MMAYSAGVLVTRISAVVKTHQIVTVTVCNYTSIKIYKKYIINLGSDMK